MSDWLWIVSFAGAYYFGLLPSWSTVLWGFAPFVAYFFYRIHVAWKATSPEYPNGGWSPTRGFYIQPKPRTIVQDGVVYEERVTDYKRVDFWGNVYQ